MTSPSSSRLERALELFCEHQQRGGDVHDLMQQHPDLADLLASFVDEMPPPTDVLSLADCPPDFEPVREVGRGGVGVVYETWQKSLGRRVALKMLHETFAQNPSSLARFHREAQLLARLDHPGIVRVHAASTLSNRPWLAMEFVDGESLAQHLQRLRETGHQGASMRRLVAAIAQVAEALHHAHTNGIVHRDVKPSNILFRDADHVVLSDFGLARAADAPGLTRTGVAAGTPFYMAPERILASSAGDDSRSDIYSLGLTLFECLALRRAFDGATSQEVLHRILTTDPPELRRVAPGVPSDLAAIVHKAIEREPARRYANAQAFADDLRAFLDLRPIAARPPSPMRRLTRYLRRHPMVGAMTVVSACGLVFAIILAMQWPEVHAAEMARRNDEIEDEIVLATLARSRADAADCLGHFRRAIELGPDRDEAIAGLCLATYFWEGAERALQELERHPHFATSSHQQRLRVFLLKKVGREAEAAAAGAGLGDPRDWMDLWLDAVPLAREDATPEEQQRANQLLTRALMVAPRPRLWLDTQYASLQVLRKDDEGRRNAAETLLSLWPGNPRATAFAGTCMLTLNPHRAAELLSQSFDGSANDALNRVNLGVAMLMDHRTAEGAAELEKAMASPDLTEPQRVRVLQMLHIVQDFDREAKLAEQWLQRQPENVAAKRFVARTTARAGDTERALQLFRECVAAAPQDLDARSDYAFCLEMAEKLDEAVQQAQQVVDEHPALDRAHDLLLDLRRMRDETALAVAELERWVAVSPNDAKGWRNLAAEYLKRAADGDPTRALDAAQRADYLKSGKDSETLAVLAEALEKIGEPTAAARVRARAAAMQSPAGR